MNNSEAIERSTPEISETESEPSELDLNVIQDTSKEGLEEYSNDEDPSDNELTYIIVEGLDPIKRIILHIAGNYKDTFLKVVGKRRLYLHEFNNMLIGLRLIF